MINIRPVSDLKNKLPEIEKTVLESNGPVFLTKNGYGTMVLLSFEQYTKLTDDMESKLDEADAAAEDTETRYSAEEIFGKVRAHIHGQKI
jgi:PHD/YefM family antitoxin component YafN of YafNO toxin-antitoxin module